ncbi:MAG: propanediol utilization protein [Propionibacteriaceae bacterium]|jgi:putative phosphotransacetylase|nr:propanediol utilization protein [Propionibacteriaceae bacterium]
MLVDIEKVAAITAEVCRRMLALDPARVPIGVSNRHVHLDQADLYTLFGLDAFEVLKPVRQPGEFAAVQRVDVIGPRATFKNVRCMGPCRKASQVELSLTDARALGIQAPVTQSGHLENAAWVEIVGPHGTVRRQAAIAAARHIHMGDRHAAALGLQNQDLVRVAFEGTRGGVLDNFIIRTKPEWVPEIHLDTDEANALGVTSEDFGRIVR